MYWPKIIRKLPELIIAKRRAISQIQNAITRYTLGKNSANGARAIKYLSTFNGAKFLPSWNGAYRTHSGIFL